MQSSHDTAFYPALDRYFKARLAESSLIPPDRRRTLESISAYIAERVENGESARLTFICTHNARRSQMAQIWAQTAARFFGIPRVSAFSGGTEASAFASPAVSAIVRAGFWIDRHAQANNLVYVVHAGNELPPIRAFSKTFQDPANPGDGFCAVMTCSSADRDCPVIPGADKRVLLPYEDPGSSDGTGREIDVYDDRCREICREMSWLFAGVGAA
jgi:hypothetical protein